MSSYKAQLEGDPIVHTHLTSLYGTLLEQNLVRLLEPFSRVEIAHIAELIKLPQGQVEHKLSQVGARGGGGEWWRWKSCMGVGVV